MEEPSTLSQQRQDSVDLSSNTSLKRKRSDHERQLNSHVAPERQWTLTDMLKKQSNVIDGLDSVKISTVQNCGGALFVRGLCGNPIEAAAALRSPAADCLRWTALRDSGTQNGKMEDTVKAYCGADKEMLCQRGGRYKQQLLVRGRKWDAFLPAPILCDIRSKVDFLVAESKLLQTQSGSSVDAVPETRFSLLTEQLIKYLEDDTWFALHWDKDRRDTSDAAVHPRTHDGPGDIIVAMGLGPGATVLMSPVQESLPGVSHHPKRGEAFSVDMCPGDVYVISGESRWEWRHGVSIDETNRAQSHTTHANCRSTIVWRYIDVPK